MLVCFELSLVVWVFVVCFAFSRVFSFKVVSVLGGKVYLRFSLKISLTTLWFRFQEEVFLCQNIWTIVCLIPTKKLTFLVEIGDFQSGNQKPRPKSSQHFAKFKDLIVLGVVDLKSEMTRSNPNFN